MLRVLYCHALFPARTAPTSFILTVHQSSVHPRYLKVPIAVICPEIWFATFWGNV